MNKQKLFYNGNIISVDNKQEYGAALIENDKIIGVGSLEEMQALANNDVIQIDLLSRTMVPGFIDGHSHIALTAESKLLVNLEPANSVKELLTLVKQKYDSIPIEQRKSNQFLCGWGYHNSTYPNQEQPTAQELDKISPIMPIALANNSGHSGVYNSAALKFFGITEDIVEKPGEVYGRYIDGPLKGKLNGFIAENAYWELQPKTPQPSIESCVEQLEKTQMDYIAAGITFAHDGMVNQRVFNILSSAAKQNKLIIPVASYVQQYENPNLYLKYPEYHEFKNNFKIFGLKMFVDGSPQQRTAWMTTPYLTGTANNYGTQRHTQHEIYNIIKTALVDYKVPIIIHNNGDAAAQAIIDNFARVKKDFGIVDVKRSCLIHNQFMRPDQIQSLQDTGLLMSMFVTHIYQWGDVHIKNLGMERAKYISACNTALKSNISFSFHDDTPVLAPNYLMAMHCAVNRITKNGVQLSIEEKISPYEALKAITYNAAYQYGQENIRGSITVGKLANFVILDQNPLTCNPLNIKDIQIVDTYINGELIYHNEKFDDPIIIK